MQHRSALLLAALVAFLSGWVSPAPLPAQEPETGELSGTVVDSETGEPVPGASVSLEDTTRHEDLTDEDGRFVLSPVSAGLHEVTVRHLAYGEHHQ
ncbi:MAG: carboxypeptidase regulatory-like domain-containing protein, partial [Longimicrobiales bacterium]|nr:carboxypeptidase regulatory-like domain-containing protein [Longimicrobiales bacterium]